MKWGYCRRARQLLSRGAHRAASPPLALSSGLLRLPHFGDCTHEGHPVSHGHDEIASRVAVSQSRACVEAVFGEAGAARVAIMDEHRQLAGVGVPRGGHAADVPAVTGREERQEADRGVLGRMRHPGTSSACPAPASACRGGSTAPRDTPGARAGRASASPSTSPVAHAGGFR